MKSFAELLTEYMERTGIGDAELARRIQVSRPTPAPLERGGYHPPPVPGGRAALRGNPPADGGGDGRPAAGLWLRAGKRAGARGEGPGRRWRAGQPAGTGRTGPAGAGAGQRRRPGSGRATHVRPAGCPPRRAFPGSGGLGPGGTWRGGGDCGGRRLQLPGRRRRLSRCRAGGRPDSRRALRQLYGGRAGFQRSRTPAGSH